MIFYEGKRARETDRRSPQENNGQIKETKIFQHVYLECGIDNVGV